MTKFLREKSAKKSFRRIFCEVRYLMISV